MNKDEILKLVETIALESKDEEIKLKALIHLANTYETKNIMEFLKENPVMGENLCMKN